MASTSQTLIIGANVWDGLSAQTAPGQVLVVDGRIQRVGDAIEAPPDARVVDLSGHTLTPGFMDCHVHVTLAPPLGVTRMSDSPCTTRKGMSTARKPDVRSGEPRMAPSWRTVPSGQ